MHNDYISRLNNSLSSVITEWWKGLSKEELLEYIRSMPDITADAIRQLFEQSDITINIGTAFMTAQSTAEADLFNNDNN